MSSSSSYPGWVYLLAGVAMGLFIAFLLYLQKLPDPETLSSNAKAGDSQSVEPTFDFYTILPELEVVVPGLEVLKEKKAKILDEPTASKPEQKKVELAKDESFVLQVGSFKDVQQADKLKASLALVGLEAHIQKVKVDKNTWHRVRLGPFADRQALNKVRQRLQENDFQAITLKVSA